MGDKKIAIIGGGNLGQAIMKGLLANEVYTPKNITITKRNTAELSEFKNLGVQVTQENAAAVTNSELIILALKPYKILSVLEEILPQLEADKHLIVSLASGVSISQLNDAIKNKVPVYRAMPNTAAVVSESLTCISPKTNLIKHNFGRKVSKTASKVKKRHCKLLKLRLLTLLS